MSQTLQLFTMIKCPKFLVNRQLRHIHMDINCETSFSLLLRDTECHTVNETCIQSPSVIYETKI